MKSETFERLPVKRYEVSTGDAGVGKAYDREDALISGNAVGGGTLRVEMMALGRDVAHRLIRRYKNGFNCIHSLQK